jgi:hypothetical protein
MVQAYEVKQTSSGGKSMKPRFLATSVLLCLALCIVAGFAAKPGSWVQIPFTFIANGKELPAGKYLISPQEQDPRILLIRSEKGADSALLPVITRLSASESSEPRVVFDKVGEKHYLSEVYLPRMDGFQLPGAPGEHSHQDVKGTAK